MFFPARILFRFSHCAVRNRNDNLILLTKLFNKRCLSSLTSNVAAISNDPLRSTIGDVETSDYLNTVAPPIGQSFNLASFANKSPTLQGLVELGVDLFEIEQRGFAQRFLQLDFDRDIAPRLLFAKTRLRVEDDDLAYFVTLNPRFFDQDIPQMETRCAYLESKRFNGQQVSRIFTRCPTWINFKVNWVDARLGALQKWFKLSGDQLRHLVVKQPKLMLIGDRQLREATFSLKEEMGFDRAQLQKMIMDRPRLLSTPQSQLSERFSYLHNSMGISHELIRDFPSILTQRLHRLQERHLYLKHLSLDQFDPTKANFVSLKALVEGKDAQFCQNVAKTCVEDFNSFLKTC